MKMSFNKSDVEIAKKELKRKVENIDSIKDAILDSDLSIEDKSILAFNYLNPQTSGPFIEKMIKENNSFTKINPSEGRGDFVTKNNVHIECKAGMFNKTGKSNIPQCRPYQDLDFYLIYKYDPINDSHFISLCPAKIIKSQCEKIKSSSHGTKLENKKNKIIEKSISISYNSKHKKSNNLYNEIKKYSFKTFDDFSQSKDL